MLVQEVLGLPARVNARMIPDEHKALRITTETQSTFVALEALVGIATLKAKQGNVEQAHELSSTVLNHPASLLETKTRAEKLCTELEARMTPQQTQTAQAETRKLRIEQVIHQVLEQP